MNHATQIVMQAASEMADRAKTYDNEAGERSMDATVTAFEAVTGHSLTVEQGWLFMALLKAVRSQQGAYREDSYVDGAAYFGLAGEAACQARNGGWTPSEIKAAALTDWDAAENRMDAIGQNGPTGEHYQIDWLHEAPADATHWDDYECEWLKTLGGAWFSWSGTSWLQTEIDPDYLADLIPRPHPLQEFAHLAPAWADRLLQPGGSRIVYAQNADGYGEKIAVSDQSHGFEQALILKR